MTDSFALRTCENLIKQEEQTGELVTQWGRSYIASSLHFEESHSMLSLIQFNGLAVVCDWPDHLFRTFKKYEQGKTFCV